MVEKGKVMSSRTWWKVAQIAAVLPVLALLASCAHMGHRNNTALARKVWSLEQRLAQLEQRDTGTADVEAVKADIQALAAKVGQLGTPAIASPVFDETLVAEIAGRQVAATVERSIRQLRAEFENKIRAMGSGFAARAARDRQPRGGKPRGGKPPARDSRRPQPQKMTSEQIILRKTEQIAQRAGLAEEQARELGKIMIASRQGFQQLKEQYLAKEITKEEYNQARRDARQKDLEAKEQFLADLDADQRKMLEKVLRVKRPGKREKKGGADKQKRRGKKKGRRPNEK